jgi:hypothetical protein
LLEPTHGKSHGVLILLVSSTQLEKDSSSKEVYNPIRLQGILMNLLPSISINTIAEQQEVSPIPACITPWPLISEVPVLESEAGFVRLVNLNMYLQGIQLFSRLSFRLNLGIKVVVS